MRANIETRRILRGVCKKSDFENLLNETTLSDEDKEIMRMIYLKNKPLGYIADLMGYSVTTIKRRHKAALDKIYYLL